MGKIVVWLYFSCKKLYGMGDIEGMKMKNTYPISPYDTSISAVSR